VVENQQPRFRLGGEFGELHSRGVISRSIILEIRALGQKLQREYFMDQNIAAMAGID
jgi:hypothetical protein